MIIKDIMSLPVFRDVKLLSGHTGGIANKVANATFIDAPDGYDWCKEGDFIVTTGYPFIRQYGENGIIQLLKTLVSKQCSGVGIKLGRYISNIPEEAINYANQNNFPIFSLPNHLSWSHIIYPIISHINKKQQSELEKTHQVYEKFHQFLRVQGQGNLQGLAKLLLNYFPENKVTIYIRNFNKIINTDKNITTKDEIESLISTVFFGGEQTIQKVRWKNKDITVKWILNSNLLEGVIILWNVKSELTTWRKAVIEQSSTIVSLEIEHLKTVSSTVQHFRNEFISDLLSNQKIEENVLFRRAQEMGWTLEENYKVILLDSYFTNHKSKSRLSIWQQKSNLLELMQNKLVISFPEVLLGLDKNNYFALLITESTNIKNLFQTIKKIVFKNEINFTIGGTGRLEPISNLNTSYNEANQAINIAKVNNTNVNNRKHKRESRLFVLNFSELGIERIIFSNNPENEINHLRAEILQEVITYDKDRESELMLTLKTYLKHNGNIHDTAKNLIVHKNTVRYRLNTIEKLTQLNLSSLNDQLLLKTILIGR